MGLPKSTRTGGEFTARNRLNFLKLTPGQHIIRFLHPIEDTTLKHTHWIKMTSIECPDPDTCPVCAINKEILLEVGGDFKEAKKVKGFNPWTKRYYANILDLTPVKISPDCEKEFENKRDSAGRWPIVCEDCGASLAGVEPQFSHKVKILAGGITLFNALDAINESVTVPDDTITEDQTLLDDEIAVPMNGGVPVGLDKFDIVLMVQGTGRERQVTPVPQPHRIAVHDLEEMGLELYDLDRAIVKLDSEEVKELLRGVALKDIFAARNAEEGSEQVSQPSNEQLVENVAEVENEVTDALKDLFDLETETT
jgi:hypothetical protein